MGTNWAWLQLQFFFKSHSNQSKQEEAAHITRLILQSVCKTLTRSRKTKWKKSEDEEFHLKNHVINSTNLRRETFLINIQSKCNPHSLPGRKSKRLCQQRSTPERFFHVSNPSSTQLSSDLSKGNSNGTATLHLAADNPDFYEKHPNVILEAQEDEECSSSKRSSLTHFSSDPRIAA